jgi:hypothetical protein
VGKLATGVCDEIEKRCPPGIDWSLSSFTSVLGAIGLLVLAIFLTIWFYERSGVPLTSEQRFGLIVVVPGLLLSAALLVNAIWWVGARAALRRAAHPAGY